MYLVFCYVLLQNCTMYNRKLLFEFFKKILTRHFIHYIPNRKLTLPLLYSETTKRI